METKFTKVRGLIAKSLNASRKSWRSFFKKYGFAVIPANPEKRIVELYRTHGNVVLTDVNSILATGEIDGFSGLSDVGLDKDTLGKVLDTVEVWIPKKDGDDTKKDNDTKTDNKKSDDSNDEKKQTKIIVGVFVGLCFLSILAFVLIRKFNR